MPFHEGLEAISTEPKLGDRAEAVPRDVCDRRTGNRYNMSRSTMFTPMMFRTMQRALSIVKGLLPVAAIATIAITAGHSVHAQAQNQASAAEPPTTTFHGATNEVIVPVTATDSKGRFISDLVQSDFHIFDEGREQKIDYFSHEQSQPVVIGFLIDMSNRMKVDWDRYKESTTELMLNLLPGDKKYSGYLITYGNQPELVSNTNSDPEVMVQKIAKMKPAGGSALFDAIYMACTSRKSGGRRALPAEARHHCYRRWPRFGE